MKINNKYYNITYPPFVLYDDVVFKIDDGSEIVLDTFDLQRVLEVLPQEILLDAAGIDLEKEREKSFDEGFNDAEEANYDEGFNDGVDEQKELDDVKIKELEDKIKKLEEEISTRQEENKDLIDNAKNTIDRLLRDKEYLLDEVNQLIIDKRFLI